MLLNTLDYSDGITVKNKIIIDEENAKFYARFCISTKPSASRVLKSHSRIPGVDEIEWWLRMRLGMQSYVLPRFVECLLQWIESMARSKCVSDPVM